MPAFHLLAGSGLSPLSSSHAQSRLHMCHPCSCGQKSQATSWQHAHSTASASAVNDRVKPRHVSSHVAFASRLRSFMLNSRKPSGTCGASVGRTRRSLCGRRNACSVASGGSAAAIRAENAAGRNSRALGRRASGILAEAHRNLCCDAAPMRQGARPVCLCTAWSRPEIRCC